MKKTILIILIAIFSISIVFMGTGCNTAELEELKKIITDAEGEAQDLQDQIDQLESELSALKAVKNLIVFVVGEDGYPLSGAKVILSETEEELEASEDGAISLMNLTGDTASFSVYAQGYLPKEESAALKQGLNGILVSMERDPFGLLPSEACMKGEALLYIEDFQDSMAQGYPEIEASQGGWAVEADPETKGNFLISATGPEGVLTRLTDKDGSFYIFDNAVLRVSVKYTGNGQPGFWWMQDPEVFDNSYIYILDGSGSNLQRHTLEGPENVAGGELPLPPDKWYNLEISTFEGLTEIWIDGRKIHSYNDPNPFPGGTLGLKSYFGEAGGTAYYDNISVCELSAPFTSIFSAE